MNNPNRSSQLQYWTQCEALATWGLWSLQIAAMLVTYTRLDPAPVTDGSTGGVHHGTQ